MVLDPEGGKYVNICTSYAELELATVLATMGEPSGAFLMILDIWKANGVFSEFRNNLFEMVYLFCGNEDDSTIIQNELSIFTPKIFVMFGSFRQLT